MSTQALIVATTALRHRWGEPLPLQDQTERVCANCSLVKITMHPPHGLPWRVWRHRDGSSFTAEGTPPCRPPEVQS